MTDILLEPPTRVARFQNLRLPFLLALTLLALALVLNLLSNLGGLALDDEALLESTLGRLATWMAHQTGNDPEEILSPLAVYADNWAKELGAEKLDPDILYSAMRNTRIAYYGLIVLLLVYTLMAIVVRPRRAPALFFVILLLLDALLFLIPSLEGSNALTLLVLAIMAVLAATVLSPGKINRVVGFFLALSFFLVGWEASKAIADSLSYKILLPQQSWRYQTEETMEDALAALLAGDVDYVIADRKDLDDLMPPHPPKDGDTAALPYQGLRYLASLDRSEGVAILPITPAFPGRLSIAARADAAPDVASARDIFGGEIATIAGDFADERFLSQPRSLVLLDLKILNDLNLPHLQMIAEAFLQPARRNGELLLLRILADAGVYTFSEAIFGFVFGAILGFILGSVFAHSPLMERGLLPYVVASQTVPILAIAPMVVIWLGAGQLSVAVIAAYLTFFPVTINTLRGLQSPAAEQVELLRSYAASRWTIMWKLRLPAALPYIFTALKASATASVVGAIIGELPSGIGDGLGRAILDFSSDYSMVSTPKLWASIVMAAAVGILFFVAVTLAERVALRVYVRESDGSL
ncbi:MAG: ABC transporter permease [Chloroflexi bacterium]|nr:ABC transporter permease [Chloroflexota bacterium]